MGRHSASDEDVDESTPPEVARSAVSEAARAPAVGNGRHSVAEDRAGEAQPGPETATEKLPNLLVESPFSPLLTVRTAPAPRAAPAPAAADAATEPGARGATAEPATAEPAAALASGATAESVATKSSGTRGDLQLLREQPRLRAKCAAAVVVPFLIFTAVLIALGRADVFLIWFWIPTVLAGILVGALLDRAYARQRKLLSARDD